MIIIGEKINGAIPSVMQAIERRDSDFIRQRAVSQAEAGADFIDCAASTSPDIEYESMCWLIDNIQDVTDTPICIDSPDANLLAKLLSEDRLSRPGMVNSVNEEGLKCETIFPLIAGTDWNVIGLCCDRDGIPVSTEKRLDIAKSIIEKADKFGVNFSNLHIDPCVLALATTPSAMMDFSELIIRIHEFCPEVKVTGAVSNISFDMPARKYVNLGCLALAINAGIDSVIVDPCNVDIRSMVYSCEALVMRDKGGRKYNRAYRNGLVGIKK